MGWRPRVIPYIVKRLIQLILGIALWDSLEVDGCQKVASPNFEMASSGVSCIMRIMLPLADQWVNWATAGVEWSNSLSDLLVSNYKCWPVRYTGLLIPCFPLFTPIYSLILVHHVITFMDSCSWDWRLLTELQQLMSGLYSRVTYDRARRLSTWIIR